MSKEEVQFANLESRDRFEILAARHLRISLPSIESIRDRDDYRSTGVSDLWQFWQVIAGAEASEIDRLRDELATAKRNEHNSEVAYKAAIERQEELRQDLELTRLARQGDQIEIDGLKALCDGFRAQLADAAKSLETISRLAGRDEFMEDMTDVRGYANSRATVARGALSVSTEPPAPATAECTSCDGSGEYIDAIGDWRGYCSCPAGVALKNRPAVGAIAEQKCETCHDQGEVFVSKGKFEYGMLTEPEPIYKPCPDCAEPANKESAQ